MSALSVTWFCLVALLLGFYAVMDGFDLGAGMIYGLAKDPERKKRILHSISPFWSGNEVWLLAGIGSLLAAFPPVYSALLSALYVPVILVLMALIFRACGVELRSKTDSPALARFFDLIIAGGSLLPAWGIGLVAGNVLLGLPLDASGNVEGSWLFFLHPFALATGLVSLAAFGLHGSVYVALKTGGEEGRRFQRQALAWLGAFAALVLACALASPFVLGGRFAASPTLLPFALFALLGLGAYAALFLALRAGRAVAAFASSALGLLSLVGMSASLLFPVLLPSRLARANDISIVVAASPDASLRVLLILALIALPLIAVYTFVAYRSFRAGGQGGASGVLS
jgi:cytochrome d ubiquinol oxidase subunit II